MKEIGSTISLKIFRVKETNEEYSFLHTFFYSLFLRKRYAFEVGFGISFTVKI